MDLLSEWIRKNYDLLKLKESVVLNEKRNPILRLLFQIPNEKNELHPLGDKKKVQEYRLIGSNGQIDFYKLK